MIDLHAHVLPGIDDGPPDLTAALALAATAAAAGTEVMAATPHIGHQYRVEPLELPARVHELNAELERAGIALAVCTGGELAPSRAPDLDDSALSAITIGPSDFLLLECPFTDAGELIGNLMAHLQGRGFRILLGHPERSPAFLRAPDRLARLIERGAYVQITASALLGGFGRTVRKGAWTMVERGLVHVIASDAHDAVRRPPLVEDALLRAGLSAPLVEHFTATSPAALLDGAELPIAPRRAARRGFRLRR
jgi:protein-tyrosine phosphatase